MWPRARAWCGRPRTMVRSGRLARPTRLAPGRISCSSSRRLGASDSATLTTPVALPPGCARLDTRPLPTGSVTAANTIGIVRVAWLRGHCRHHRRRIDQLRLARHQFGRKPGQVLMTIVGIGAVVGNGLPFDPAELAHFVEEGFERDLLLRARAGREHTDAPRARCGVLRPKRQCASRHNDADGAPEHATPVHWITSSARSSNDGGMVRPSALAVLRLITSSTLVGCRTGRSAGLAPLRILPV